jgi:nucleoside-diphosphate-sugar epimerase
LGKKLKHVLVTGGAGYCGSVLVPQMLDMGYRVTVYDIQYYGCDFLDLDNPSLTVIQGDIRDNEKLDPFMTDVDAVLHLACISNDASFELDENLSTSVNLDAFEPIVLSAKKAGVRRFIFASSSSVYGISEEPNVKECHPLVPLTLYNEYKGLCEPILFKHTDDNFVGVVFRPATVCGYGPRQRLDVSVNILTNLAVNKGNITVFGGSQLRPNLHIQDYADLCKALLEAPDEKISNEIFNCGYENMSIMEIAETVKKVVEEEFPDKDKIGIEVTPSDDLRSYHINSDKITEVIGFKPQYSVEDAIRDLCLAFREGKLPNSLDNDIYFNVRTMKKIRAA